MTTVAEAIDDLRRDMEDHPDGFPILRWHAEGSHESQFFNEIAAEIATGYSEGRYSYEFGDFVANALWCTYIDSVGDGQREIPHPDLLRKVYGAFDAGEMADPSKPPHDPVATYTDPMIADILGEL
jgi:hypothetical protein